MERIYYGWKVAAAGALALVLVVGIGTSSFGVFVVPVAKEFGISRATANMGLVLLTIGGAIGAPTVGRLCDLMPMRPMMVGSAIIMGLTLIALGLSHSLWLDAVLFLFVLSFVLQGAGNVTVSVLVARWFRANRGRALALTMTGMSLGTAIVPLVAGWLVQSVGWRMTLIIAGIALIVVLTPLHMMLRDRPREEELEPARESGTGHADTRPRMTIPQILREGQFWAIAISMALVFGACVGFQVSAVPLALDRGWSMVAAATLMTGYGLGSLAGKLSLAVIADRINREVLLAGIYLVMAVLVCAPLLDRSYAMLMVSSVGVGMGSSCLAAIYALFADRFGTASFGTVQGLPTPLVSLSVVASTRYSGAVYDATGNYDIYFITLCGVLLLATVSISLTRFMRPVAVYQPVAQQPSW